MKNITISSSKIEESTARFSYWSIGPFNGDNVMNTKNHLDQFLATCDIYLLTKDDVMVNVFIQTLVGPTYDQYLSILTNSISCFNNIQDAFLMRYS